MAIDRLDTIEGTIGEALHFHLDLTNDVLYLRFADKRDVESYSDETEEGHFIVRDLATDEVIGMTIISYWKRFGHKALPEVSLEELQTGLREAAALFSAA